MILTCSACNTSYSVDGSRFTPTGRKVRCVKCGHSWFQEPVVSLLEDAPAVEEAPAVVDEGPAEEFVEPPAPEPAPRPRPTRVFVDEGLEPPAENNEPIRSRFDRRRMEVSEPAFHQSGRKAPIRWVVFGGLLGAVIAVLIFMRQTIAEAWPETASLYAFIGMPINLAGLEIRNVGYGRVSDGGTAMLEITGNILNPTSHVRRVPRLRITLRDASQEVLHSEDADSGLGELQPGQVMPFTARIADDPKAQELEVRLIAPEE